MTTQSGDLSLLQYANLHAIFGFIAVGLGLVNIVAGVARPSPDHRLRPVFTWSHRVAAILAFVAACKLEQILL